MMNYFHLDFIYYGFLLFGLRTEKELGHINAHFILMHYGLELRPLKKLSKKNHEE